MTPDLSILYRGDLSSCNYACTYCPFAKTKNTREELAKDADDLARFCEWVGSRDTTVGVLFTPWGEAMIRKHYQSAFQNLSQMDHVSKVAVQTNLSGELGWVESCDKEKIALWCTYHETQTTFEKFVAKCDELYERGVSFSVGVVGLREHFDDIRRMRSRLPDDVYVWVNAYKRDPNYYEKAEVESLTEIDPLFPYNNQYHESAGFSCRAGASVISVDGEGNAKRCHFIKTPIGNIYDDDFHLNASPTACTNATCGCFIGYVHLERLGLYEKFEGKFLERIYLTS